MQALVSTQRTTFFPFFLCKASKKAAAFAAAYPF